MRSLELVRYNATTGKFELGEEALAVLRKTRGPVGVVAVAGRARQGKSYILNQLLGTSGGFTVGPTHRPCTKGLWMWSAPVERTAPDGSKYSLVLLDTEGIDAYDQVSKQIYFALNSLLNLISPEIPPLPLFFLFFLTLPFSLNSSSSSVYTLQTGQYSTQIFSLAVLLSSLFIYNQMGGIDEAALDRLSLVTEMTKHIRVKASDGASADPSELAAFTPSFIWLLRDFYLKLEEDGHTVTPRDYLESALQALPGNTASIQSKNNIRESIKALFPNRDCFTLVRPVNDEDALANLDTLNSSQLRPEFRQGLAHLTRMTFQKAMPKRLGTQILTGPSLAGLAEAYVSAINAGAVPTIATAWQGVAEAESRRAADAAEAAYAASFPADVSADDVALESAHQSAMLEAQQVFDGIALGDESVRKANERRWKDACNSRYRELREKKLATAALACEKAINEATTKLAAIVRREGATMEDLHREATAFKERYAASNECSGPDKWPRLAAFMQDVYGNAQRDLAAKVAERQRAEAQQAKHAAETAQAAVQQAAARATAAEASVAGLQARVADLERQLNKANTDLAAQRQAAAAASAQLSQLSASVQSRDAERAAIAAQLTAAQQQVAALQQEVAVERSKNEGLQREAQQAAAGSNQRWASEKSRMEAQLETVILARDAAEAARAAAEAGRNTTEQEAEALRREIVRLQGEIASLQAAAAVAAAGPIGAGASVEDEDMFFNTEAEPVDEIPAVTAPAAPAAVSIPDTSKMSINDMKQWLTDHGHEGRVWEMSKAKAKKNDWVTFINSLGP